MATRSKTCRICGVRHRDFLGHMKGLARKLRAHRGKRLSPAKAGFPAQVGRILLLAHAERLALHE